jgi:hypothetical protein
VIDQGVLFVLGTTAVWLSQDPRDDRRKWACIIGITAQPFWLYATWKAEQWGIFALTFVYAAAWIRGIWHFWIAAEVPA